MRLRIFCAFALLAGSTAAADFTYLHGNLADLLPNSGGTVSYRSGRKIELKTPLRKIAIPYAGIVSVELGDVHTPTPDPLYKVWSLKKRFSGKGETQELTVTFKGDAGQEQTATLELARDEACALAAAIHDHNDPWWGDDKWRTTRNAQAWTDK